MVRNPFFSGIREALLLWSPFIATLVLAAGMLLMRYLRRRRRARGEAAGEAPTCRRCGYNLTGTTVPRCPECGTLVGFRVPMEAMGLTEAELQAYAKERASHTGPDAADPSTRAGPDAGARADTHGDADGADG